MNGMCRRKIVFFYLLLFQFHSNGKALFTVEISSPQYVAEFHGNVTMECRFPPGDSLATLVVYWHRVEPGPNLEVYKMVSGLPDLRTQDSHYRGRVWIDAEELSRGRVLLHIYNLQISDLGRYQCMVEMEAADHKQTTLSVQASYRNITATVPRSCSHSPAPVLLQCQAAGFPLAHVKWTDSYGREFTASTHVNTTHTTMADGRFSVTSQVRLSASCRDKYTCTYVSGGRTTSASILLSAMTVEGLSRESSGWQVLVQAGWVALVAGCGCALVALVILLKRRGLLKPQGLKRKAKCIQEREDKTFLPDLRTTGGTGDNTAERNEIELHRLEKISPEQPT